MGNLLCLLTGLLLPFLALGLAIRRGLRPLSAASAYRNVAWQLGLEADTRGASLQGYVDRRRLFVGEAGDPGSTVRAVLDLATPLGLGLRVRRRARTWRRQQEAGLRLGDPELDEALTIEASLPDRAQALFVDEVRTALSAMLALHPDLDLDDHHVSVTLTRAPSSARRLLELVQRMRALASALEQARAQLPPPPEMEAWIAPWATLADTLGLTLDRRLPALRGVLDGHEVQVGCVRRPDGYRADLRVVFHGHDPTGLVLTPQQGTQDVWTIGQDILVGDEAFDEAFVIKGYDPVRVREILTDEARAALLELLEAGRPVLDDQDLDVYEIPLDPDALETHLRQAVAVARGLRW